MSRAYNTDGLMIFPEITQAPVCLNPLESIERAIAFDVKDWAESRRDAWIYAIVFGWGDPEEDDAWTELCEKHGWDKEDIERAVTLHQKWEEAKEWLNREYGKEDQS